MLSLAYFGVTQLQQVVFKFAAAIPAVIFRLNEHGADVILTGICGKKWGAFDDSASSVGLEACLFLKLADRSLLWCLALVNKTFDAVVSAHS